MKGIYEGYPSCVRIGGKPYDWFKVMQVVHQGVQ